MADAITTKNITSVDEVQSVDNTDKVFVNDNGSFKQISVSNLMKQAPSGVTEETDPTVPSWAKEPTKPTYTAEEVGALPVGTKIPSKTSDLINDSGYLTQIPEEYVTETELGQKGYITEDDIPEKLPSPGTLTFTGAVNDTYDGSTNKTINIPTGGGEGGTSDYNDLTNQPQLNGVTLKGNKTLDQIGAVQKSQGSGNSGKYLSVGSDGNVTLSDPPASGGALDPEQVNQAVENYLTENPPSGMTAEQEQQLNQNTTGVSDLKSALEELKENLPSGITPNASSLLITILRSGVFNSDQSSNITELEKELQGNGGEEGGGIDENVKYGLHNDLGYTGKLETGLVTSTTSRLNIDKIVLDIDIKTDTMPTGSYILISYFITDLRISASGKWMFAGSATNVIADKTPDDVMGNGRTTITFSNLTGVVESNANQWVLMRGNAQETPEAIWYNVKFYSGDILKADLTPTSKLGDMYDSVSGKTRSFSEIDGLELVEVK